MFLFQNRILSRAAVLAAALFAVACDGETEDVRAVGTRSSALETSKTVAVVDNLRQAFPKARLKARNNRLQFMDGDISVLGDTPEQSAETFKEMVRRAYDAAPGDLVPLRPILGEREVIAKPEPVGVMYDRKTGAYKFQLYYFGRQVNGIPVYGNELLVLVRNAPGYPVVSAASSLRNLDGFAPKAAARGLGVDHGKSLEAAKANVAGKRNRAEPSEIDSFSEPKPVIYTGKDDEDSPPRSAVQYVGESTGSVGRWRFIADAISGEILNIEDEVHSANVWGRVMGNVTLDPVAAECAAETPVALPFAEVSIPAVPSAGFTGPQGYFFLSNPGTTPVSVVSTMFGQYIDVHDYLNMPGNETLTTTVTPPGPAYFLHNQANNDEHSVAQSNAYYHVNLARSVLLSYFPDYPVISTQVDHWVDVNGDETYRLGGVCPADARYIHGTIVFCESGYGVSGDLWTNTAFGTIAYHEYAHHILESVYADTGEYCEGFADAYAVLIAGDPRYARGYIKNDCNSVLRNADNDCQYDATTCTTNCGNYEDTYGCARLLSGIIWDLREALRATHPADYMDILMPLFIDQAKYHAYNGRIDPVILDTMLMLDDDDGDVTNGTPHSNEICSAFEAHGFDCPIAAARPCDGLCSNPVTISWSGSYQSGDLQTGAVCRETLQNIAGGNCGNFAPSRTLSVNGTNLTCNFQNWASVPAKRNGGYCIRATAGDYPWAFFTLW